MRKTGSRDCCSTKMAISCRFSKVRTSAVRETYGRIARDVRHHGLLILLEGQSVEQMFPEWSMAFRDLTSPEVASTPGFQLIPEHGTHRRRIFIGPEPL